MTVASIPSIGSVDATATSSAAQSVQAASQPKAKQTVATEGLNQAPAAGVVKPEQGAHPTGESTETTGNSAGNAGAKLNTYA